MKLLLTADPELPVPPEHYGGIERIIAQLIAEFRRQGHQVGLVANGESTAEVDAFFAWPGKQSQHSSDVFKNSRALRKAVTLFKPDIVHSFSRLWYLLGIADRSVPRLMSYQREPSGRTVRLSHLMHRGRLQFTGCSEYIAQAGRVRGGGCWHAIHNFADAEMLKFQPIVANDAPLVFLSRIEPIKGAHIAIEIALKSNHRLLIAGNYAQSGPHADYWANQIVPYLGKNGIEYVGPVNDVQKSQLLGSALAMVVPIQWNEPFGIVFAEALACGTPVISCPRGALPEIIQSGVHGYLIDSVDEGVDAVNRTTSLSRQSCRRHAEENFSSQVIAEKYLSLYAGIS